MKKILFSLVALVASMSMNAQVMKVMENGKVVAMYKGAKYTVVFEEEQTSTTTGTAKRTGDIDVNWVQLWENGPKFAEYNVGATSETEYGGYYSWGGNIDKDKNFKYGNDALTGDDDTATKLWGSAWRMPTQAELQALLDNCDVAWTDNYKQSGVKGRVFTGKGDYAFNSVFLPAAGRCEFGYVGFQGSYGYYWSSMPDYERAQFLYFDSGNRFVNSGLRDRGYSVRAVLAE